MIVTPCIHAFAFDPWEPGVRRCIYCDSLYEDVMPLKLPPHAPPQLIGSSLVRALRGVSTSPWRLRR